MWFNSNLQISAIQAFFHSWGGIGEAFGRLKVIKLVDWDKDSFLGKAKAICTSRGKQRIPSPLSTDRCSAIPRKARLHHTWWWLGKTTTTPLNIIPFLLSVPDSYADHDSIWYGISLWTSSPSCVPSQPPVHFQPPFCWDGVWSRKDCAKTVQQ